MNFAPFSLSLLTCATLAASVQASDSTVAAGALYTATNDVAGNAVLLFDRATDGSLTFAQVVPTGGLGTGGGLGNQGGVLLSQDERFLFVVNAGSHEVSVFAVLEDGLALVENQPSGGLSPTSITQHDDVVYVLNADTDSVVGFHLSFDGELDFLSDSRVKLSAVGSAPAQVGISPDGEFLFVTERATNTIARYTLDDTGRPVARAFMPSAGATPFGFAFGLRNQLLVSEAFGGDDQASTASSYSIDGTGQIHVISSAVATTQTAACWLVTTPGGRLAYTANTGSDSVSSFSVGFDGSLTLLDPVAAATADGPLDMTITRDGKFFYVLTRNAGQVGDYSIGSDGSLTGIPGDAAIPTTCNGLAVR